MRTHASFAHHLALRTLRDPIAAEDAAQEAFVRAWRAIGSYHGRGRFSTWLYRIVVNCCYDRLPALRRELNAIAPEDLANAQAPNVSPERAAIGADTAVIVRAAIATLPAKHRLLITLRHIYQLSYAEIAEVTEMPLGTVKTGIHRGRSQLRERLLELGLGRSSDAEQTVAVDTETRRASASVP